VAALDDAPPVVFVDGGFEPPDPEPRPTRATFADYSPPESLFYHHDVEREVDRAAAPTPHAALGVGPGASWTEIRAAYRRLVAELHPDRHVTASAEEQRVAAERLAEVNVAYHTLARERR
jgi:DnaJ-domain-containing protein 1